MNSPSACKIVLASTSLRRKEILSLLGLPFLTVAPRFEEITDPRRSAREEVEMFAQAKAKSVAADFPEGIILGSDTLIDCQGEKIGKPTDPADAVRMLHCLRGTRHTIYTAVTLLNVAENDLETHIEAIHVTMAPISDLEIENYVATGEAMGKAGAFSLQEGGHHFIKQLEGDFLAAVGLPLKPIVNFLKKRNFQIPQDIDQIYQQKNYPNWHLLQGK